MSEHDTPTKTDDPSGYVEAMVALGLRASAARRELDQLADDRRAALLAWIDAWGLSLYAAAPLLGVTRQHLYLLRDGECHASDELYARAFDLHREWVRAQG